MNALFFSGKYLDSPPPRFPDAYSYKEPYESLLMQDGNVWKFSNPYEPKGKGNSMNEFDFLGRRVGEAFEGEEVDVKKLKALKELLKSIITSTGESDYPSKHPSLLGINHYDRYKRDAVINSTANSGNHHQRSKRDAQFYNYGYMAPKNQQTVLDDNDRNHYAVAKNQQNYLDDRNSNHYTVPKSQATYEQDGAQAYMVPKNHQNFIEDRDQNQYMDQKNQHNFLEERDPNPYVVLKNQQNMLDEEEDNEDADNALAQQYFKVIAQSFDKKKRDSLPPINSKQIFKTVIDEVVKGENRVSY